jgi:hypothetical protein
VGLKNANFPNGSPTSNPTAAFNGAMPAEAKNNTAWTIPPRLKAVKPRVTRTLVCTEAIGYDAGFQAAAAAPGGIGG